MLAPCKKCLATAIILGYVSCISANGQSLAVNIHNGRNPSRESPNDAKIVIDFNTNGLIGSFLRTAPTGENRREYKTVQNGKEVVIDRIVKERGTYLAGFRIGTNSVVIKLLNNGSPSMSARLMKSEANGTIVIQHLSGESVDGVFTFDSHENAIDFCTSHQHFSYTVDSHTNLPVIATDGPKHVNFRVQKNSDGKVVIDFLSTEGLTFSTYTIDGELRRSDPMIAVMNFELIGDPYLGAMLFPYIGGAPMQ